MIKLTVLLREEDPPCFYCSRRRPFCEVGLVIEQTKCFWWIDWSWVDCKTSVTVHLNTPLNHHARSVLGIYRLLPFSTGL